MDPSPMSDFFPAGYRLTFNQFNYDDLEKKILMLLDSRLLSEESKQIKKHVITNYNEAFLFSRFENILNKYENE